MRLSIKSYQSKSKVKANRFDLWLMALTLVVGLAVFQDYVFSSLQNTGFYISESLLYNSIWVFLVPFTFVELRLTKIFSDTSKGKKLLIIFGISTVFSLLHVLVFALFFVVVSYFAFSPVHRFTSIFFTALSNQMFIIFLFYLGVPFLKKAVFNAEKQPLIKSKKYAAKICIKIGSKRIPVKTEAIQLISTNKPYSVIFADDKEYLDNRTLKDFEAILSPNNFLRVHRSFIVNSACINKLISRQNGDYDALLKDKQTVRLSRHYRDNWDQLLQ